MSLDLRTIQDLWSHLVLSPAQSSISQITLLMAMSSCVLNTSRTGGSMTSRKPNKKSCTCGLITKAVKEAGNWMSGVQLCWKGPKDLIGQSWAELAVWQQWRQTMSWKASGGVWGAAWGLSAWKTSLYWARPVKLCLILVPSLLCSRQENPQRVSVRKLEAGEHGARLKELDLH